MKWSTLVRGVGLDAVQLNRMSRNWTINLQVTYSNIFFLILSCQENYDLAVPSSGWGIFPIEIPSSGILNFREFECGMRLSQVIPHHKQFCTNSIFAIGIEGQFKHFKLLERIHWFHSPTNPCDCRNIMLLGWLMKTYTSCKMVRQIRALVRFWTIKSSLFHINQLSHLEWVGCNCNFATILGSILIIGMFNFNGQRLMPFPKWNMAVELVLGFDGYWGWLKWEQKPFALLLGNRVPRHTHLEQIKSETVGLIGILFSALEWWWTWLQAMVGNRPTDQILFSCRDDPAKSRTQKIGFLKT